MIETQAMYERFDRAGTYSWVLSYGGSKYGETFLAATLCADEGAVVNAMKKFKVKKPFTVCSAECKDGDAMEALRAALVGDVVYSIDVVITGLTKVE